VKILVAGGAGYVGSALVPSLVDRGYEVTVVDLLWFGNNLPPQVPVVRKDLMEIGAADLEGVDQVIFLGGLSNDPMAEYSPSKNFVFNAAGPAYLAYMAKLAGVKRFIYGGSCSVYGYTVNELYDESAPAVSHYPYGISKLQGEFAALQMKTDAFSVIAFRKGTICGYSPRMRFDLVVNTMFKTAVADGIITVNNPSVWRPILSMQDAVSAYTRAVECSLNIFGVFNIASGNYTLGEIADEVSLGVEAHFGRKPRLKMLHNHDLRNYKVNFERAQHVLSFKPRHQVGDIVAELAVHRAEFGDFSDQRYYNLATFKHLDASTAESAPANEPWPLGERRPVAKAAVASA
jgi:nucleoside-diphosphate-sugar epimerase